MIRGQRFKKPVVSCDRGGVKNVVVLTLTKTIHSDR